MHHVSPPGSPLHRTSGHHGHTAWYCWLCPRPFRTHISKRAWATVLMIFALTVVCPLFFADQIRQMARTSALRAEASSDLAEFHPKHRKEIRIKPRLKVRLQSQHRLKYPLEPRVCDSETRPGAKKDPYLVLFIPSRPNNAEERAAVRETWAIHGRLCNVRVVFGFGRFADETLLEQVQLEEDLYGDLLQTAEVIDAYHNQTRLVLAFFHWGLAHCAGAQFIGKADEDTWINIFGVLKYLQQPEAQQNAVIGHFLMEEKVKRLPEQKWFLTKAEYGNETYPPFAVGQLYVFPRASLPAVLAASTQIPIHWLDDVYIGGQIPEFLKFTLVRIYERCNLWEVENLPCFGRYNYIIHATPAEKKREIFYHPCMQKYRQQTCVVPTDQQLEEEFVKEEEALQSFVKSNLSVVLKETDKELLVPIVHLPPRNVTL